MSSNLHSATIKADKTERVFKTTLYNSEYEKTHESVKIFTIEQQKEAEEWMNKVKNRLFDLGLTKIDALEFNNGLTASFSLVEKAPLHQLSYSGKLLSFVEWLSSESIICVL